MKLPADDGERILVDACGPEVCQKKRLPLIYGKKMWHPLQRLENGSDMIRINLMILGINTEKNLKNNRDQTLEIMIIIKEDRSNLLFA